MIQLDIRSQSRTQNPTATPTPTVLRNPIPTSPKNLRFLATPTLQSCFISPSLSESGLMTDCVTCT